MKYFKIYILSIILVVSVQFSFTMASAQEEVPAEEAKEEDDKEGKEEEKKPVTEPTPLLEIKRLEAEEPLYSLELRNVELADLFRVIAHDYNLNILVDKQVEGTVMASFTNISLEEALEKIADMHGLKLEKQGNIIIAKPNLVTEVIILDNINAEELLKQEDQVQQQRQYDWMSGTTTQTETTKSLAASTVYELLSPLGKIFLGKQNNTLVVIDYPTNVANVK